MTPDQQQIIAFMEKANQSVDITTAGFDKVGQAIESISQSIAHLHERLSVIEAKMAEIDTH